MEVTTGRPQMLRDVPQRDESNEAGAKEPATSSRHASRRRGGSVAAYLAGERVRGPATLAAGAVAQGGEEAARLQPTSRTRPGSPRGRRKTRGA